MIRVNDSDIIYVYISARKREMSMTIKVLR